MVEFVSFILRIVLVAVVCLLVWRQMTPKTQAARVLRAFVLVISLFGVYVVLRLTAV